ncbi:hypothetical protein [Geotalea sp. SG265]|uniref:hypothetical protein n=1 Tax=Geotalea sp. SG265 TaxID=2922867 RepID=UPI001FAEB707|nr:hypothetical protein [Geotalea sp. SG265]
MDDDKWRQTLQCCRRILGRGSWNPHLSESWCAYTTFSSLEHGIHYWSCGFPEEDECLDDKTVDGGLWSQSFHYQDLAHLVVPAKFYWEEYIDGKFEFGFKNQKITELSEELKKLKVPHRLTDLVLEIKLY